jgi:nitrate reductase NapE component
MLLPAPQFVLVLAANLLVSLFNFRYVKKQVAVSASWAEPFSEHNPTGRAATVLTRKRIDRYSGTFIALLLTIFAAALFLPYGVDVWDPMYLAFWSDPDFIVNLVLTIGIFVLPGLLAVPFFAGEIFILTDDNMIHARWGKRKELAWKDVTDVQRLEGESGRGILLKAGKLSMYLPDGLNDPFAFYSKALQRLPADLHDKDGCRWMMAKIERRSGDHEAVSRSGNRKKWLGFVLLMACWTPILAIDVIGSMPSIALMLAIMGIGLWAVGSGNIRSLKHTFRRTFDGMDIDKAKESAAAWLRAQGAVDILVNDGGIRAVHGSRKVISVWKPGAMKNVLISFERAGAETVVKIDLQAASALYGDDVHSFSRETESGWGGWLEGLWKELEDVSASRLAPSAQIGTGTGPSPCPRDN